MTKEEVAKSQKTWAVFLTIIGLKTILSNRAKVKRILRIRWGKVLRKFCLLSRFIGRVLIRLKAIKNRIVARKIFSLSVPIIEYYKNDIIKKKKIINNLLEKTRDAPVIIHLMAKWKSCITAIQRNVRSMKKINRARRLALGILWDRTVENVLKVKIQEKIHRSMTIERVVVMPNIKKYTKMILTMYANERKNYKEMNKASKLENYLEMPVVEVKIKPPILILFNQKIKFMECIEQANIYRTKIERKQRELRFGSINPIDFNKINTKNFK